MKRLHEGILKKKNMEFKFTADRHEYLEQQIELFNDRTGHDVDMEDVIYSIIYNDEDTPEASFKVLWDYDEGEGNDPHWNKEKGLHSITVFLMDIVKEAYKWKV